MLLAVPRYFDIIYLRKLGLISLNFLILKQNEAKAGQLRTKQGPNSYLVTAGFFLNYNPTMCRHKSYISSYSSRSA